MRPLVGPPATAVRITTPEGVPLDFELPDAGERLGAFLYDLTLQVFFVVLALLPVVVLDLVRDHSFSTAAALLISFFVRNFYFAVLEVRGRGATPGKRRQHLRVIDRHGAQLSTEALVVRNLTREVELFLPLTAVLAANVLWPGLPGWLRLLCLGWVMVLCFLPLLNTQRLRVGDLVAGTVVVRVPRPELLPDLATSEAPLAFTPEQLDVYGVYELQVLERVLRDSDEGRDQALSAVAERIQQKVSWSGAAVTPEQFLTAFYAALRAHLEKSLVLGRRKEQKAR